jgi:predicted permease
MLLSRRWRRELQEEMRLHRELRARQAGAGAAERRFGNELALMERSRDMWGWRWLREFGQDVRHGLRLLRRTPLVTGLALVSLGLGIGANTALFSLADAVMLRPLPVAHPEQLMQLYTQGPQARRPSPSFTNPMWEQVRDGQDVFSGAFAWSAEQFNLSQGGERQLVWGDWASGDYFATLGVSAERGRLLGRADDFHGCPAVADISDAFWKSHFGASEGAIGATLRLDGRAFTVIGVMPAWFYGMDVGTRADVVAPLCAQQKWLEVRDAWWLAVVGRLKPGVTEQAAQTRIAARMPGWLAASTPTDWGPKDKAGFLQRRATLQPGGMGMSWFGRRYGTALEVLLATAGLVLLVACANLAGLMLARATARRQEMAVRMALGAGRGRLIRQLLTESLLLAAGGAGLGALFADWAGHAGAELLQAQVNLTPDGRVLGFGMGLTLAAALLVGLAPALGATRGSLAARARREARGAGRWAAVAQVAMAVVLLAGAGLFLRSFANLTHTDLGFDPQNVTLVQVGTDATQASPTVHAARQQRALAALQALPGVRQVSASFLVPTTGLQWDTPLKSTDGAIADAFFNAVSPGYFATLRTPLLAGRDFSGQDSARAPKVIILNQTAARQLFPNGTALGQVVEQPGRPGEERRFQVVGVVADAKYLSVREPAPATGYFPQAQLEEPFEIITYEIRSPLSAAALAGGVKRAMAAAGMGAYHLESFDELIGATLRPERLLAWLSGLFGGLALLLTAIGLYGIMAYNAERRRREFGVRMALGATRRAVVRLAVGELGAVLGMGIGLGVVIAWAGARGAQATLSGLLFGLRPTDGITLAAAVAVLAGVALAAAWLPARRAARADPMASLREE